MIPILYQDEYLLVCRKPAGVASQPDPTTRGDDLLSLLGAQLDCPTPGLVHRLDRGVGGVMVFGKRPDITAALGGMVSRHEVSKEYLAVLHGRPDADADTWRDLLYKDTARGKSFVVDSPRRGVKEAVLDYALLSHLPDTPHGPLSLLRIRLHTGRTHQIRVQCSSRGMPLVGDGKYGARDHGIPIALWSHRLTFAHPRRRGVTVDISALPEGGAFALFD